MARNKLICAWVVWLCRAYQPMRLAANRLLQLAKESQDYLMQRAVFAGCSRRAICGVIRGGSTDLLAVD